VPCVVGTWAAWNRSVLLESSFDVVPEFVLVSLRDEPVLLFEPLDAFVEELPVVPVVVVEWPA